MRTIFSKKLELGRIGVGHFASPYGSPYGAFFVSGPCGEGLKIISSAGDDPEADGWEHVSVSIKRRNPNWEEMCFVKNLFFEDEETVVQFHPPKSSYVNNHEHCLHLWRYTKTEFPRPPTILVGIKDLGNLNARATSLR
jgi:hypothetical protein